MAKRTRITELTSEDHKCIRNYAQDIVKMDGFFYNEIEDVIQELSFGLFKESRNYRCKKATWSTFREQIIKSLAGKIKRKRFKPSSRYTKSPNLSLNKRAEDAQVFHGEILSIMDCVTQDELLANGTEEDGIREMGLIIDVRAFMTTLPEKLRQTCEALMEMSPYEAAKHLGVGKTTIYSHMKKLRELMCSTGLGSYVSNQLQEGNDRS